MSVDRVKKAATLLLLAGTLLALPAASEAQPLPRAEQARLKGAYFSCVLEERQPEADTFLSMPWGAEGINNAARELSESECLNSNRRFHRLRARLNWTKIRHGLFVAQYRRDFGNTPPADFSQSTPVAANVNMQAKRAKGRVWLMNVADCVARRESKLSYQVLMASRGSNQEMALLQKLVPAATICRDGAASNKVDPDQFLGQLAEALSSLRQQPAVSAAPSVPRPTPFSDPGNEGGWIYNAAISDEFDGEVLDEDRWFIVGKFVDGKPTYIHPDNPKKFVWKGRAPSQFSGRNHRLEDGILVLEARWEPDFPFSDEIRKPAFGEPLPYENITTPSLIQRREFTYGYMETRAKVADAQINSAFWSIGRGLEIDVFELFGDGRGEGKEHLDTQLWWSIRDWKDLKGKPVYTERRQIDFRPADDFHVYGLEWNKDGVRYFLDGKLIADISADDVRKWARENNKVDEDYDGWVADRPIALWLDMETFPWHGVPESLEDLEMNSPEGKKDDGIVEFEVDYVRLWQRGKPSK